MVSSKTENTYFFDLAILLPKVYLIEKLRYLHKDVHGSINLQLEENPGKTYIPMNRGQVK